MKAFLVCLFAIVAVSAASQIIGGNARVFKEWMMQHGKVYASTEEMYKRFEIFQENTKAMEELRNIHPHATFDHNEFSDLSEEEFAKYYLNDASFLFDLDWPIAAEVSAEKLKALPTSFDWKQKGVVTPVKNQGQCGSCWSFSATGNVEGQWALAGHKLISLSEQNLVDCEHLCGSYRDMTGCDHGCNGGLMPNAFKYIADKGIEAEATYPYTARDDRCAFNESRVAVKTDSWTMVSTDEEQMMDYLVEHGPIAIAADASTWHFYSGGILTGSCGTRLNHGILITGYGEEKGVKFWDIKNSWGTSWGDKGYLRVERGTGKCGVNLFACSATVHKKF